MSSKSPSSIRRDVQGLRAIAVIAVFLFHLYPERFTYGYLGVDVFIVISGFVVSSVVLREVRNTGSFRVWNFVRRRARRLLPVLVFVLAITTLSWLVFAPVDTHSEIVGAAVSAVVIGANVFFHGQSTDYFAGADSPFIHLWSLSMEEQFYLLLVVAVSLLIVIRRRVPQSIKILISGGVLFALSLGILGIIVWFRSTVSAANLFEFENSLFYFPVGRAWQFLAGIAVAATTSIRATPQWMTRNGGFISQVMVIVLLVVMLVSQESANAFLSWQRIIVTYVTAAAIFVHSGMPDRGIFSSRLLAAIGDRSYSIYLWHIPVISFWQLLTDSTMNFGVAVFTVLVATEYSYRLVEHPYRFQNAPTIFHWSIAILSTVLIGSLWAITRSDVIPRYINVSSGWQLFPGNSRRSGCSMEAQRYVCGSLSEDVDVVLIGDSHAMSLSHVFADAAESLGLTYYVSVQPGCRILGSLTVLDLDSPPGNDCEKSVRFLYSKIEANATHVFVAECPTRVGYGCPDPEMMNEREVFFKNRRLNLLKLNDVVSGLSLIEELPFVNDRLGKGRTLFRTFLNSDVNSRQDINFDLEEYLESSRQDLWEFAKAYPDSIEIFELRDVLCDLKSCLGTDGQGRDVWANEDHLTIYGAELVRPPLEDLMREVATKLSS